VNFSSRFKTFGFFMLLILTIFISTSVVLLYIDNRNSERELENYIQKDRLLLEVMAEGFVDHIDQALSDIIFLEAHYHHEKNQTGEIDFETFLRMISQKEKIYDQIRYIDQAGQELVRVNFDGVESRIVEKSDLQDKSSRYYFTETIQLLQGDIYISALDLNMENGALEIPYKPMLRFATPLIDPVKGLEGIAITNLLAQNLIDRIVNLGAGATDCLSLINNNGYFIAHEDPEKTFGFMIESRQKKSFMILYPEVWQQILEGDEFIQNDSGIFQVKVIDLKKALPEEIHFSDNEHLFYGVTHIENTAAFRHLFDRGTPDQFSRVLKTNGILIFLVILAALISNILIALFRDRQSRILHHARYDALTETYNRRAGLELIQDQLETRQSRRVPVSLCFIDIDNLKATNDRSGHPVGDILISTVAGILKNEIRNRDILCRYGGDEFIILFDEIDTPSGERIWDRIQSHIDQFNLGDDPPFEISLSHGIVTYDPRQHTSLEALIHEADQKMYAEKTVKKSTRNPD